MASRIEGLDRLNRKLKLLPLKVVEQIKVAMASAADDIVAMAKSLCPADSGALRESITWVWGDVPKGLFALAAVTGKASGSQGLKITVVAGDDEAYYARWIEFGTAPHLVNKGGGTKGGIKVIMASGTGRQHPGSPAQPFFYPAFRANRRRAKGKITRAINKAAKEVAAGGG